MTKLCETDTQHRDHRDFGVVPPQFMVGSLSFGPTSGRDMPSPVSMKAKLTSITVVMVGRFTPSDFGPSELAEKGAISEEEANAAIFTALLPNQMMSYRLPWGTVQVVEERLSVETTQTPYIRAADLVVKCLRDVARGCLVNKFGINFNAHFVLSSAKERDALGTRLAPPDSLGWWGLEVGKSLEKPVDDPQHGGLTALVVRQGQPDEREGGWIDVRIEPSSRFQNDGVFISVNDHYQLTRGPKPDPSAVLSAEGTDTLLKRLEGAFDSSVERSERIAQSVLTGK